MTNVLPGQVIYQVYVNEVLYKPPPNVIDGQLDQAYGRHDMFHLRIEIDREYPNINNLSIWPDDVPIRIVWGRTPDLNTWYGYVNHHNNRSMADSGTQAQQLTYECIGTSAPMNIDKTRTWENVSPTYIAKKIATEYGLRAVVTPINVKCDEMQAQVSDFVFLNEVADKYGMRFYVSGGTLYFVDPAIALFGNQATQIPIFYHDKNMSHQDTVRHFEKKSGLNMPGGIQMNRTLHGLDHKTGQLFKALAQTDPKRLRYKADYSSTVYAEAKTIIEAEKTINQFYVGATAQLFGNCLLYPGKLVNIQGYSTPGKMAGNWLIVGAKHRLADSGTTNPTLDKYMTDVEIVRNTESGTVMLKGQTPVMPEIVACHLANNLWVSNNQAVISEPV